MKDLVHHLHHIQKKVVSSSRKANVINENKINGSQQPTKFPLNAKKKTYETR